MIELVFENSTQFLILLIVVLLGQSSTRTIYDYGLQILIADGDLEKLALSCLWSLVSMVLAGTNWQDSLKHFTIGVKGKLTMATFFLLSVFARTIAFVIYFAPSMGLLDLLGHYKMGTISANRLQLNDIMENGTTIYLKHVWNQVNHSSELTILTLPTCYFSFIVFVAAHQVFVFIIKCLYSRNFISRHKIFSKFLHVISQQFCPKIYQDWDEDASTLDDLRKKFEMVKNEIGALLILFTLENFFLSVPIMLLSIKIYERNKYLDEFFPQLDEEIWSTKLAYGLSAACPVLFILIPLLQYWLFILYNKYAHPWSKLLRDNLEAPDWLIMEEQFMDEMLKSDLDISEEELRNIFKPKDRLDPANTTSSEATMTNANGEEIALTEMRRLLGR